MSSVYVSAPPTQGKIVLHTSLGPIDVELWSKETPRTSRNFVQLCMEGYYDNTIFHRAIKDFMLQGGDPTGTGTGGESIYGEAFKDEIHSRLRFAHRGIVAMANTGPNTNNSQFFITLDKCDWIEKQYTIFGKVTGDSIYNLIKANSLATDKNDRPLYPPKLLYTEVIWNPFDDIEPRVLPSKKQDKVADQKPAANRIKNKNLLSFGDEVGDDEEESVYIKKQTPADKPRSGVTSESQDAPTNASSERPSKAAQPASVGGDKPRIAGLANRKIVQESEDSDSEAELTERDKRKLKEKEEREKEMKRLKREIKKIGKEKEASSEDEAKKPKQSFLQMQREKFRQGKHHLGDKGRREAMVCNLLDSEMWRVAVHQPRNKTLQRRCDCPLL
eukprot:TRINITY_DN1699_c0_g1_i4.p1 TRINITY_DN1699_c0_g1~~TRINITY_DN1699_c0_g1_i4.p1  ORF type:complete len:388 (+),score=104.31 TRINITY_DN1699_c0_g1_i4:76-1239(+)